MQPYFTGASAAATITAFKIPFISDELQAVFNLIDARVVEGDSEFVQKVEFSDSFADVALKKPKFSEDDSWMIK